LALPIPFFFEFFFWQSEKKPFPPPPQTEGTAVPPDGSFGT